MNMDPTPVDRCVCHNVMFAELLRLHRETGADLDRLQRLTRCGTSCGVCLPYIRVVLTTGRVRLPVMPFADGPGPAK
jgi:NAD(P)H-nitrite reductase large subunit